MLVQFYIKNQILAERFILWGVEHLPCFVRVDRGSFVPISAENMTVQKHIRWHGGRASSTTSKSLEILS